MSDEDKVDFEAIGRYHAAMKQARIALTMRNEAAGELREMMAQMTATGHAEFRVAGERLKRAQHLMTGLQDSDALLQRDVTMATEHAAAAGEEPPSVEMMVVTATTSVAEAVRADMAAPVAVVAHDAARDLSGGN